MARMTPWHHATPARRLIVAGLAAGSIHRGIAYMMPLGSESAPSATSGALEVLRVGPSWSLGLLWLIAGLIALVSVLRSRWVIATAVNGGLWLTWGGGYLVGAVMPGVGKATDWISAGTYLWASVVILGALLIRESPRLADEED